ncbi:MAG: hypothetical protein JNM67_05990, partial [Bacteroidetes bacterium]|nr:hypothetical protein [Bacteroidota bacterium]
LNGNIHATFGNLIQDLQRLATTGRISFRDSNTDSVFADLVELNDISWKIHHGSDDILETQNEIDINSISMVELVGYLNKTIDLLDNRI